MVTMETEAFPARARRVYSARTTEQMRRCRSVTPSREIRVSESSALQRPKSRNGFYGYERVPIVERLNEKEDACMQRTLKKDHATLLSRLRPVSAPHNVRGRSRSRPPRTVLCSARGPLKSSSTAPSDVTKDEDKPEMQNIVKAVKEAKTFKDETMQNRNAQVPEAEEKKDGAPVFNKRLFASQGTVIMTREARRLMNNNSADNEVCDTESHPTKAEVQCLRCVTEGLKLIHKSEDFVKDVLSRVITYELYNAYEYVQPKSWEDALSCYYILNGAVEVSYDLRSTESRNVYQANIIYSHGTGEYLGLVSPEGPTEDLAPPATIYTKELTQFIRVDRARFHAIMTKATQMVDNRKRDFLTSHSFLANVSNDVKEKILHKFSIQDFPANRVLLSQGERTEYLFIVMSGRCQTYREVYIPEAEKDALFYLTSRDPDDFFGEECILDKEPSICTVVTATATTCLKLHKSALQMVQRDRLARFIEEARHEFLPDSNLRDRGYNDSVWNRYKHGQVKGSLKEGGKLHYLTNPQRTVVYERPLHDEELYVENMRRFVLKGSQFEPLRAQSAKSRKTAHTLPVRPKTAIQRTTSVEQETIVEDDAQAEEQTDTGDTDEAPPPKPTSTLLTTEKAKELEKKIAKAPKQHSSLCRVLFKALESKENLLRVLEEDGDAGNQPKHAWKTTAQQEQQNFMKNGVLVTMTSEDIVRKAKALADTYADKWKSQFADNNEEEWDTILHAENKQAKMLIGANRLRIKDLKRKMAALQKQRERTRQKFEHSKRIPSSTVNSASKESKTRETVRTVDTKNDTVLNGFDVVKGVTKGSEEEIGAPEIGEVISDSYGVNGTNGNDSMTLSTRHFLTVE